MRVDWLPALLLCLVQGALAAGANNGTEFSASLFLNGVADMHPDGSGASACSRFVDHAAGAGLHARRLQFVVSVLWWDEGPATPPPGWPGCSNFSLSTYYCYSRFNSTRVQYWSYQHDVTGGAPTPVDAGQAAEFGRLLGACFKHAVDRGFDISVNLHADDGRALGGWRNTLEFDPTEPLQGFSYVRAFLHPTVDALAAALGPASSADVALQGEMGATVFFYPREWAAVADAVRERFARARAELRGRLRLGLGINNSKLCGCALIDIIDYNEYLEAFAPLWPQIRGEFDLEAIQALFYGVDFVGISAYVPQRQLNFTPCDFESLMSQMDREFSYYGLTLRQLLDAGKALHWIEFGIGGSADHEGRSPTKDPLQAIYYPYFGVGSPYKRSLDPWTTYAPDQPNPVRDVMRHYYRTAAQYLEQGGCTYRVTQVDIWNLGSWDVLGLYPGTTSSEGSYRDQGAVDIVTQHNVRVNG